MSELAILGGDKKIKDDHKSLFKWPIVTKAHEEAVLEVLRAGNMSGTDVTMKFEDEYAKDIGMDYALACNTGTAAIHCGLYGLGVGVGDEVICPTITYWASILQVYSLGATPVFADIEPDTLCVSAEDIEKRITPRTKAIVVVHYCGMPADMDAIMAVAKKHGVKVFEDCSHSHTTLYKGKETGTIGDASGFSLMTGKSFAIGEGGIMFTNDQEVYERALLFGHYSRHPKIELEHLKKYTGLPSGGYKYRMHQLTSAFGRVQLTMYREQFAEIDKAMTYFCDLLDEIPGLTPVRPAKDSGSNKGGWYLPLMHYNSQELGGLSVQRFVEAVKAEGVECFPGCNKPLHDHILMTDMDVYGHGKPTRVANLPEGVTIENQSDEDFPVGANINDKVCMIPWFKHYKPEIIKEYADVFAKVVSNYQDLLEGDTHQKTEGGYSNAFKKKK